MKTKRQNRRLNQAMTVLCAAVMLLGLTTGSVLAVEVSDEDATKLEAVKKKEAAKQLPAHEQPAPANPAHPTGGSNAANLAAAATNPVAAMMQFQLQNTYNWKNYNSEGYSNVTTVQAVIPVKLPWEKMPMLITRETLPYVTTPDLGEPVGRVSGFGDFQLLLLGTPKLKGKGYTVGVGMNTVWPTAGANVFTGNGKYQAGPAALYLNMQTPTWQWGIFAYQLWSYGSGRGGSERADVSKLYIQPVLTKHFKKGWYIQTSDTAWDYDWKAKKWNLPLGGNVGRVMKLGKLPVKIFGEILYNPISNNGPIAKWTFKANITFLFPE